MSLMNRVDIRMWRADGENDPKDSNILIVCVWITKRWETDKITLLISFVILIYILIDTKVV